MKKVFKYMTILVLPLLFVAGYFVPQMAFGAGIEANTVLNFIEYTPTPGPTPTPTPTPDPGVLGGLTAQTGDFVSIVIGLLGIMVAISLAFVLRRHISYNVKSLLGAFCVSMLPLALAGTCIAGLNNAVARDAGSLVGKQIDVYVNTEGGPVHYGEGESSNVQTFVNTTDKPIYIDEIALEVQTNSGPVDIGTWNAKVGEETIFSGAAGDSKKLAKSIFLDSEESFEITWETEALSEDLIGLVGTAPVKISYKTYEAEYTVTFETNGGSSIAPAKVIYGDKLTKPADPTKKDNVLKYWASDEALTHEYNFETAVTSDFTLYAYWNASEEYKEEVNQEIEREAKKAQEEIGDIEDLTDEQLAKLKNELADLDAAYKKKIEEASTKDDVDDLKAEFEQKLLEKEKEALGQAIENREKGVDDKLDDIEGLTEADLNRYKSNVTNKKNDAKNKIAAAEDFASAQKQQEKFNSDTDAVYAEAKELGNAKKAAKATSEEETKKSEAEFVAMYQGSLLPDTLSAFQEKFYDVDADTKEDIDDAISTSEVQEALANEQKDLKDLFDEAQEILDTKEAYLASAKATVDEDTSKINALKKVSQTLKDDAKSKIDAEYTALQNNIPKTDDLNKLKEIKDLFDANVSKIVEDIEKLDQDIDAAISEIVLKTKQISADIQAKGINQFDTLELDNELKKMSDLIQQSLTNAVSQEDLQKRLEDGKAQLNDYSSSIVVVALNFADGQESMANYVVSADQGETPVMNRAGIAGQNANTKINITAGKTRIQSIVDNNTTTYIPTAQNEFQFTFNKSITTITTTLETVSDEAYAYISSSSDDTPNDTLTFTYDEKRSEKDIAFDVIGTSGVPWEEYIGRKIGTKGTVTTVNFEDSFQDVEIKDCTYWFAASADYSSITSINGATNLNTSKVTSFSNMFYSCTTLVNPPDTSNWNTDNIWSADYMFFNCTSMISAPNTLNWNTINIRNMEHMFEGCSSMKTAPDTSKWKTDNVTDMNGMFRECRSMSQTPDTSSWKTGNVIKAFNIFQSCSSMVNPPATSGWDTSKMTSMSAMFDSCSSMISFPDTSNWVTTNCEEMGYMFSGCSKVKNPPDTSKWATSKNTYLCYMFYKDSSLEKVPDMNNWNTANVESMEGMFSGCSLLEEIDISSFTITENTITGCSPDYALYDRGMFNSCTNLKRIFVDDNWSNVLNENTSYYMFWGCENLPHYKNVIDDENRTSKYAYPNNGQSGYFTTKTPTITLTFAQGSHGHFEDPANPGVAITTFEGTYGAQDVKVKPIADPGYDIESILDNNYPQQHTYTIDVATGCIELRFDAEYTITATTKSGMEAYAYLSSTNATNDTLIFTYDDLRSSRGGKTFDVLNTGKEDPPWAIYLAGENPTITTIQIEESFKDVQPLSLCYWFRSNLYNPTLTTISGLENIDTSKVTNLNCTFIYSKNLKDISGASNWNVSNVDDLRETFKGCSSIETWPDFTKWVLNPSGVGLHYTFAECSKMQKFDGFSNNQKTNLTKNFDYTFYKCSELTYVDLTGFNIVDSTNSAQCMFYECSNLEHIYYNKRLSPSVSSSLFYKCENLPHYNPSKIDATYAYPNNGQSGYFTSKTPTITLTFAQGSHGHFEDPANPGVAITTFEGTYGAQGVKVKPVVDSGYDIESILDNNSPEPNTYTIDVATGCIELRFDAEYTITATTKAGLQAYAYLTKTTNENDTLVFAYDSEMSSHLPLAWNCENTGNNVPWGIYVGQGTSSESTVTTVQFTDDFKSCNKVSSCANWFNGWSNVDPQTYSNITTFINTSGTNFTNVTSMAKMFWKANKFVTPIDMSEWETSDKLTNIDQMFYECTSMKTPPDVSVLNTENVTNLNNLFYHCEAMESAPNVSGWNVDNVTTFDSLFYSCKAMTGAPDTSSWGVSNKATTLIDMFYGCENMQTAPNMSNWDTSSVYDMHGMFSKCKSLTEIDINGLDFVDTPCVGGHRDGDQLRGMFYGCENLQNIYCDKDLSTVLSKSNSWYMFHLARSLPHYYELKEVDTNRDCTFAYPDNGTTGYFTNSPTPEAYAAITSSSEGSPNDTLIFRYDGDKASYGDLAWNCENTGNVAPPWGKYVGQGTSSESTVTTVQFTKEFKECDKVQSCYRWFCGLGSNNASQSNITSFVNTENTSFNNVTTMKEMFYSMNSLVTAPNTTGWTTTDKLKSVSSIFAECAAMQTAPDMSGFNMKGVSMFYAMFQNCKKMASTPNVGWTMPSAEETSVLDNLSFMFEYCESMEQPPNVANWNVSNVGDFCRMFYGCKNLNAPPDTSNWDTKGAERLQGMFGMCSSMLTAPDMSNWDTSKVTSMSEMFYCSGILKVDISNLTFTSNTNTFRMFYSCENLFLISSKDDLSSTLASENSISMFTDCTSLPHYDYSKTDRAWAFPDDGQAGYFTDPHPTITLDEFTGGHYEDPNSPGQAITQIDGDWDAENVRVKVVVDDQTKKVNTVMDNANNKYPLDNNEFTVDFSARYSISVTLRDKLGPKAVYEENNKTFTFYWDNIEHEGEGIMQFDVINTSWSIEEGSGTIAQWQTECSDPTGTLNWPTIDEGIEPEAIVFDESFKNTTKDVDGNDFTSMSFWFCDMYSVKSVSGLKWVPETVTDISGIFSKFEDTGEALFNDSVLDLTDLKTANVTNVDYFLNGTWFETVTLPSAFAPKATKFSSYIEVQTEEGTGIYSLGAFAYMKTSTLNIPGTVGGKITNASMMFYNSDMLESLDLPSTKLNLSEVEKTTAMFAYCYNLESINLTDQAMTSLTTSLQMFRGDHNLQAITVNKSWDTLTGLTNSANMFLDCFDLPHYDPRNPIVDKTYAYPDNGTSGYFAPEPKTAKAVYTDDGTLTFYYDGQQHPGSYERTVPLDVGSGGQSPFLAVKDLVTKVVFTDGFKGYKGITNAARWFKDFVQLTTVEGISNWDTSAVKSLMYAFDNTKIESLDLTGLDLSQLHNGDGFKYTFVHCSELKSLIITQNIDPSVNVTSMLESCESLQTINTSKINFSSNHSAFRYCVNLESVTVSGEWATGVSLGTLLYEYPTYSEWTLSSTGEKKFSNEITGNASGETYTKVVEKNLSDYTIEELASISDDIATKGQSSSYWTEFNGYLTNAFNTNSSTGRPYDNGNTSGTLEDSKNHMIINGVPCRIIGLNHDPANGESGITMMATAPVTTSIWGSFSGASDYGISSVHNAANNWASSISSYCKTITKKYSIVEKVSGSYTSSQGSVSTKGFILSYMELMNYFPSDDPEYEYKDEGTAYNINKAAYLRGITSNRFWTRTLDDVQPYESAVPIEASGSLGLPSSRFTSEIDVVPAFCLGTSSSNGILDIVNLTSAFDELLNLFAVMLHID